MKNKRNSKIQYMIEMADHILISNGIKRIQENDDFTEDAFSHEDHVVYTCQKDNSIELRLAFSSAGVDIGINDFYEVHSLAYEQIEKDSSQYEQYLNELFFEYVVVEKCSFGLNCYYAKDAGGQIKLIRKVRSNLLTMLFPFIPDYRIGCKSVECRPIFPGGRDSRDR